MPDDRIGFEDTPPEDPLELLSEGMMPLPEGTDLDVLVAAYDVIGRAGAADFEVGYDDALPEGANWYARCTYPQAVSDPLVQGCASPHDAAERLARKLVNGGKCTHCGKVATLWSHRPEKPSAAPVSSVCYWTRAGKQWIRGCMDTHDEGQVATEAINAFIDRTGSPAIREVPGGR